MATVACPGCTKTMDIDAHEVNTEWECPSCSTAFVVDGAAGDALQLRITQEPARIPNMELTEPTPTNVPAETQITAQAPTTMPATSQVTYQEPATTPAEGEIPDDAYVYAVEWLSKGSKPGDVRKSLIAAGYTSQQADRIIQGATRLIMGDDARERHAPAGGHSGDANMIIGGIICLIGLAVTLGSCAMGGGNVIIAWGAIVFGAIQYFRGLSQRGS